MNRLVLTALIPVLSMNLVCNPNECPPILVIFKQQGDGLCNLNCMTPYCNYDIGSSYNTSSDIQLSDCLTQCLSETHECNLNKLGNGICDESCNIESCGLDFGDCGYCAPLCILYLGELSQLGNECDQECNTTSCYYDLGACLECAAGCNSTIWGDGICNKKCNNKGCNYDNGDCFNVTCATNCYNYMIGNSICDEACYVEECNFDSYDCDCSPGCSSLLLQNDVCDEICNNGDCDFDNGECGYCAIGCFLEMLRNDVCDEVCDTFRCKYDNYTCGCSLYCRSEDYGKCKSHCLVSECNYDRISSDPNKWCDDIELIKYTIYQQYYDRSTSSIVSFDRCSNASSYKCSLSMSLDEASCYPECYFKECNFGLCHIKDSYCAYFPEVEGNLCSCCGFEYCKQCWYPSGLPVYYSTFTNLLGFQLTYLDSYKVANVPNFSFYYVTSTQKGLSPSGNGSLLNPFETLDYALNSMLSLIQDKEIAYLYLFNDGNYTLTDCRIFSNSDQSEAEIIIASLNEIKILIKINGWSKLSCTVIKHLKFENIIFDGSEQYASCNNSKYCEYCSYNFYNESDGYYYSDRSERIEENIPANNCQLDQSYYLTLFFVKTALTLKNVEIRNWRFNYDSIISGIGKIELINVIFDNIWLSGKETNAIIYKTVDPWNDSYDFTYIGGSVTRLNNGFEFGDPLDFRGFLYSESYTSSTIKNVDFKYNLVYLKPKSSLLSASLIYIKNMRNIEISNCIFIYNYCETGIFYTNLNVENYNSSYNETMFLTYLTFPHIKIQNTSFISNYVNFGLIHIEFLGLLLNIHLSDLTIELNGAETDSLIYIYNALILDEYKVKTAKSIILPNSRSITAISLPRWCKLINITFKNNHARGMINAINLVNLDVENLELNSNGSPYEDANINSLFLDYFIENRDIWDLYISKRKLNIKALGCDFMVTLSNSYNLELRGLNISNNICRNSSPTTIIYNSNFNGLTSVNCSDNVGNGLLPICFYFTGSHDRNFTNSLFIGNINNRYLGYGALQIENKNNLYLINCTFINNSASLSPSVYFTGLSVYIESSIFKSNESRQGNGGALYFVSIFQANKGSSLIISSSDFIKNSANIDGGAIFLVEKSKLSMTINLIISGTTFIGNQGANGAALYIDDSVALTQDSVIIASSFNENNSKESGTIFLYYSSGILSFKSCEFIENSSFLASVLAIDITEDTKNLRSKVIIELSVFKKNTGNSVIYVDNQNRNSTIETKMCVFEYNNGRVVSLNFDYFSDHGSVFQFNSGSYGACFLLQNSAVLYASSQFLNNTSEEYGGAIVISFKSVLYCDNCIFIQNKASGKGGALNAEQDSQFVISNSKFIKNSSGNDGSAIFAFNCNLGTSSLYSSQFSNNHASNVGVINLISSKVAILSSILSNNTANGYTSGLSLTFSDAEIYNSKFENQTSSSGNFIYLLADSRVYAKNATFCYGKANERGGAIFSSSSVLSINDSFFSKLSSPKGGAIYATFDSQININSSEFVDVVSSITGGIINANQVELFIANSYFNQFSLTGIYGKQVKRLEITNSSLSNGSGPNGGALYCESCKNIEIESCSFTNNTASLYGGALFLNSNKETNSGMNVITSKFLNNSAQNGGAIYSNGVNLNIILSHFAKNKAFSGHDLNNRKIYSGIGGGININCIDANKCKFNIDSNSFLENTAEYNGGGISWDDQVPLFLNNTFHNNIAECGGNIASYPIKLMKVKEDGSLENFNTKSELFDPISSLNLTEIASGQNIKNLLLVALVDDLDNIISTDNLSEAELKSVNLTTQISGTIKVTALKGIFNFSDFVISDEPGSNIQIMVTSSAIDAAKIKISGQTFYSKNLIINVNMRKCKIGEVKSGKNCEICPEGFYSLNPDLISCIACPDAAECYGSYRMAPKPGYWRDNMYTDKFWKCPHPPACLGSSNKANLSYIGECSEAYKGNKCQSCKSRFSYSSSNKCEKCPEYANNVLLVIGILLGFIILSIIIVKTTRQSALKPKSHVSIYIKIFLNYTQMIILASTFKLNWSAEVLGIFKVQNNADYVYQQIYSFQCLFDRNESSDLVYFRILIFVALIPAAMVILSLLFWTFAKWVKASNTSFWDDFISTCIILLFLIHPSIVKKMFASMNCTEINTGEYWLEENLDIRCWNYDHIFYITAVSLPSIILWGIILPTICLANIIKDRHKLNDLSVRFRYGFLFNGYKENHFYWEFIIMYSKIILICCSVFLTRISLELQALIVAILYSIYLRLQYSNNPYTEHKLNQMELRAKIVCAVTIWSGLYYLMGSLSNTAGYFFFAFILIANFYFLIYWAFYFIKSISQSIVKKVNNFRKSRKIKNLEENSLGSEHSKAAFNRIENSISSNSNFMSESQVIEMNKRSNT